jgi:uncharacterized protein YbjT (DUF2867 family)
MTEGKTAFVFGASGLVGGHLVKELIKSPYYSHIYLVVRKPLAIVNLKVREIALDKFEEFDFSLVDKAGAQVFCCVGTTIKKAGTREEFRKVDFELPLRIADWAKTYGISTFGAVSSIGANSRSSNFYLKTKGEMEEGLKALHFQKLVIVRPSLLLGTRSEFRLGEEMAKMFSGLMKILFFGPFKKYRAIEASTVARSLLVLVNSDHMGPVFESDNLEALARGL